MWAVAEKNAASLSQVQLQIGELTDKLVPLLLERQNQISEHNDITKDAQHSTQGDLLQSSLLTTSQPFTNLPLQTIPEVPEVPPNASEFLITKLPALSSKCVQLGLSPYYPHLHYTKCCCDSLETTLESLYQEWTVKVVVGDTVLDSLSELERKRLDERLHYRDPKNSGLKTAVLRRKTIVENIEKRALKECGDLGPRSIRFAINCIKNDMVALKGSKWTMQGLYETIVAKEKESRNHNEQQ